MTDSPEKESSQVSMLDPFEIWKKLYFSFEDSLTRTIRESVGTDSFANGIDWILNSYLQYLKLQKDFVASYMDETPLPTKHDVARVAQLVISLETKVDKLEDELDERLQGLEEQTSALAEQLADLSKNLGAVDVSPAMLPTLNAVKEAGKRIGELEKSLKRIETSLTSLSKPGNAGDKPKSQPARAAKPKTIAPPGKSAD